MHQHVSQGLRLTKLHKQVHGIQETMLKDGLLYVWCVLGRSLAGAYH